MIAVTTNQSDRCLTFNVYGSFEVQAFDLLAYNSFVISMVTKVVVTEVGYAKFDNFFPSRCFIMLPPRQARVFARLARWQLLLLLLLIR